MECFLRIISEDLFLLAVKVDEDSLAFVLGIQQREVNLEYVLACP